MMLRWISITVMLLALSSLASIAGAQPKVIDGVLTDAAGMSLYWWDNDPPGGGKSVCNHACALSWPPMIAKDDASASGDWSILTREDGKRQWVYKGRPLYLWVNDQKPGDRTGDGFRGGIWHLAKP
jgi:predicted lipoprotein with Yx(FWY)xxD motif